MLLPDGSLVYSAEFVRAAASRPVPIGGEVYLTDGRIDTPDAIAAYAALLRWLKGRGIEPILLLTPYQQNVWIPAHSPTRDALVRSEAVFRRLAAEMGVRVLGSYDPGGRGARPAPSTISCTHRPIAWRGCIDAKLTRQWFRIVLIGGASNANSKKYVKFQMLRKIARGLKDLLNAHPSVLHDRLEALQLATGRIEARQTANVPAGAFAQAEFKVWSQWGEDGIIEHLLHHVPVTQTVFVEFGVETYRESNTRFLLRNRNWSGLVIDGSSENIAFIRNDPISWRHDLKATAAFITRDNINKLITDAGIAGDIGILSIDIDGNDYFVWDAIDCISPRIVIAEYNAIFGPSAAVSIPYAADFYRTNAHYSNLYWGCSLAALVHLAERKGYVLVGCNSNGNNVFFVRRDLAAPFAQLSPQEAFRPAKFRESRDVAHRLSYLSNAQGRQLIAKLPLLDVVSGKTINVGCIVPWE